MQQKQQRHYRDRYDILRNILVVVNNTRPLYRNYMNQTRLGYAARLNYPQTVEYLGQLVDLGFLSKREFRPFFSSYEITDRGRRCLQLFGELEDDVRPIK